MASITFHLNNFPTLSQLHEPSNPYPNVNADMDCVPTSIAAALTWFTGTPYYGDEVIDQVYGSSYTGGTAGSAYEAYCAARGVKLYPVNGTPDELVTAIHTYLHEECPVLVTVPGQWNNPATSGQNPGDVTHVMVVCGDGAGVIQVMNPWTGAFEVYSDSWFTIKLCYGQVWPMEKIVMVPTGWHDDGTILTAPNGVKLDTGFRNYVLRNTWDAANVPLAAAHDCNPVTPADPSLGDGSRVDFVMCSVGWTRAKGTEFPLPVGQESKLAQQQLLKVAQDNAGFQATIAGLNKKLAALQTAQGLALTPEQAAAINQLMPHIVGIAAGASGFTNAFANVPKPNVTAPLPVAAN